MREPYTEKLFKVLGESFLDHVGRWRKASFLDHGTLLIVRMPQWQTFIDFRKRKCVLKQFSLCLKISIRIYHISLRSSYNTPCCGGGFKACVTYWCLVQSGERNGCFGTAFYANLKAIEYRTHCVPERKYRGKAINDIFCLKMGLKCFQIWQITNRLNSSIFTSGQTSRVFPKTKKDIDGNNNKTF